MRVRDEDGDARRSLPRQLQPQLGGVAAGIDDDGLACRAVRAHDVAVRPDRAELVAVDGERHYLAEEPRAFSALFCAMRNISESMKKLNGMKNTMSSATLRITDPGVEPSGLSR